MALAAHLNEKKKTGAELVSEEFGLTTTEDNLPESFYNDWEDEEDVYMTASDFKMPRISLAQGTSDMVSKKKLARGGEWIDNFDNVLTKDDEDLEVLFLKRDRHWDIQELNGKGQVVRPSDGGIYRREEVTAENIKADWQFEQDGKTFSRTHVWEFYAVKVGADIETEIPHLISFQKTGTKTAEFLNTEFMKLKAKKQNMFSKVFVLGRVAKDSDQGSVYYVPTAKVGRDATVAEQKAAYMRKQSFS